MENAEKVKIKAVKWSRHAAKILSNIENINLIDLNIDVNRGSAVLFRVSLFRVSQGARVIGYYVLRVDELASGNEGVLVAAAGSAEFALFPKIMPVIEKQFVNCVAMRVHTARLGLAKLLSDAGYEPQEIVMRKGLING